MENLEGKRVLVTGAAGFVGANLARELIRRRAEVHALIRPSTNLWRIAEIRSSLILHRADLNDSKAVHKVVERGRPQVIFHLAATGGHASQPWEREEALRTSVLGTANLLEAVVPLDFERFVYLGSSLEYGPRDYPLKESDRMEPMTFRGVAKAAATLLCQQFARANCRPLVVLRAFSVYGYWEAATRLVPTVILAAFRNREVALTASGFRRDLVFVEDVVEACLLALQVKQVCGETINIGSGEQWSNEEVVQMVEALSGQRVRVQVGTYPPRPSDTGHWVAAIGKARQLLRWEPKHPFRHGLEKTISWFRLHQDAYPDKDDLSLGMVPQ